MKVIRKRLYESENLPTNMRYNETCDCVEYAVGDEWIEQEEFDPRHGAGFRSLPLSGADAKCNAAAGMVWAIEDTVNHVLVAASIIDVANGLFALIVVLNPGFGIIMKILITLAEVLFSIGTAALTISFDEEAYDQLTCIFYQEISADGQMSAAQLSTINTRVCNEMDLTVCAVVGALLNTYGEVTFSNAGALAGIEGDCDECGCRTVTVLSTTDWQVAGSALAGVPMVDGTEYSITATGSTGGYGGSPPYNANGIPGSSQGSFPISAQSGQLCGYIQSSPTDGGWFTIGVSHTFTADRGGTLRFAIADGAGSYGNNTGQLIVEVCET